MQDQISRSQIETFIDKNLFESITQDMAAQNDKGFILSSTMSFFMSRDEASRMCHLLVPATEDTGDNVFMLCVEKCAQIATGEIAEPEEKEGDVMIHVSQIISLIGPIFNADYPHAASTRFTKLTQYPDDAGRCPYVVDIMGIALTNNIASGVQ